MLDEGRLIGECEWVDEVVIGILFLRHVKSLSLSLSVVPA